MRDDIQKALEVLRKGGLILYPTDTIWGIGCDATNEEAVKKLYALKRRDDRQSMLVLIDRPEQLQAYVREVPNIAWDLIELSDRPLTLIYDGAKNLAPNLIASDGSIGIRHQRALFPNVVPPIQKTHRLHVSQHHGTTPARLIKFKTR